MYIYHYSGPCIELSGTGISVFLALLEDKDWERVKDSNFLRVRFLGSTDDFAALKELIREAEACRWTEIERSSWW